MTVEDVENELRQELGAVLNQPILEADVHRSLHDIGVDSMAFVEMMVFIEKQYGVMLLEVRLERSDIESLHAIASSIHRLKGGA